MWRHLTAVGLIGAIAGCADSAPEPLRGTVAEIASPAGEGSGEPFLSSTGDAVHLSWLEAVPDGGHDLRFATWDGAAWSAPTVIAHSERFFVNWADFPSVRAGPDGTLWAHWLERGAQGGYDYGVRIVHSTDGGRHWSEPWTPHDDGTPTEHGFVSAVPTQDGMGFIWLDGRQYVEGPDGAAPTSEMTLRFRVARPDGPPGPETLIDARVCDCCQTDAALAASGPVAVYRDRSEHEIRDIYFTRFVDGAWTEGVAVHDDGWEIAGCPVNGPAVAARADDVAVAWFTGVGDEPRVKMARSSDGGATFGEPIVVDGGNPGGRVDLLMMDDGSALVSWLERTGGEGAEVRVRRVDGEGRASDALTLSTSSSARASGFPRMIGAQEGSVLLAWTDVTGEESRVRLQVLEMEDR